MQLCPIHTDEFHCFPRFIANKNKGFLKETEGYAFEGKRGVGNARLVD